MKIQNIIENNLRSYKKIKLKLIKYNDNTDYLIKDICSERSKLSILNDPYWPKWNAIWWKLTFLYEIGKIHIIPKNIFKFLIDLINKHYIHSFPLKEKDIPKNCDPYRNIMCFCALGTIFKIVNFAGFEAKKEFNWMYDKFFEFQLPDGGFNCDEQAYNKKVPKSSIVSTLPMLEALLSIENINLKEEKILENGAKYILKHNFFRSTKGIIINKKWLQPIFPRFYFYDILRGLKFIISWAVKTNNKINYKDIEEVINLIDNSKNNTDFLQNPKFHFNDLKNEFSMKIKDNKWNNSKPELFTELKNIFKNKRSIHLTKEWFNILIMIKEFDIIK